MKQRYTITIADIDMNVISDESPEAVEAEFAALAENNKMDVARVKEFIAAEDMKGDMLVQKALEVVKSTAKAAKKPAAKKAAKKDEE